MWERKFNKFSSASPKFKEFTKKENILIITRLYFLQFLYQKNFGGCELCMVSCVCVCFCDSNKVKGDYPRGDPTTTHTQARAPLPREKEKKKRQRAKTRFGGARGCRYLLYICYVFYYLKPRGSIHMAWVLLWSHPHTRLIIYMQEFFF